MKMTDKVELAIERVMKEYRKSQGVFDEDLETKQQIEIDENIINELLKEEVQVEEPCKDI